MPCQRRPLPTVAWLSLLVACTSAEPRSHVAATPETSPAVVPTSAPSAGTCADRGEPGRYTRQVAGADRGCKTSADCATVVMSCSNTDCTGVHRDFASRYPDDIDCTGYTGPVANYDCRPRFDIEVPACREGCCVSERRRPIEGTVVGCPDGELLEVAAGKTATTSTGLAVTFAGSSIDHYDDGGIAVLLDVVLSRDGQKERRIFSANAMPEEETLLGHCVVLVEPSESKLVLRAGPAR